MTITIEGIRRITSYEAYIQPKSIYVRPTIEGGRRRRSLFQKFAELNLKNRRQQKEISCKSGKKLNKALNWLIAAAKSKRVYDKATLTHYQFKINFITLTIPPQDAKSLKAKDVKEVLNVWLTYVRKYHGLRNYIWKLEGHKDKRLHIHITTDIFLHYQTIKDTWNRVLRNRGYLDAHFRKHGNYSPNSTDVHAVKQIKDLAAYLVNYFNKPSNLPEDFNGFIWRCSYSLSDKIKCNATIDTGDVLTEFAGLQVDDVIMKEVQATSNERPEGFTIGYLYYLPDNFWQRLRDCELKKVYLERLAKIQTSTIYFNSSLV